MMQFIDLYLWAQAIKVFAYIGYALTLIVAEKTARLLLSFLPEFVIRAIEYTWNSFIERAMPRSTLLKRSPSSELAQGSDAKNEAERELFYDSASLIQQRGYPFEQHYAETVDGFLLGLHRIPHGKNENPDENDDVKPKKPVVYIMHGFLQSSEAFLSKRENLPFMLADAGFDVWLGNSRGNKYSGYHRQLHPSSDAYWRFCIDDVAAKDVPAAVEYVCKHTDSPTISYIGFSQGTAVAFACFSTRFDIARRINSFVALAPATTAKGFSQPLLDSIAKMNPDIVYFLFGKQALFGQIFYFWQNLLSNASMVRLIDFCVLHMFGWGTKKIRSQDKPVLYSHIYSMSSVRSVVHWFQIMSAQRFQMYQDEWITNTASNNNKQQQQHAAAVMPLEESQEGVQRQRQVQPPAPQVAHPSTRYTKRIAQEYPLHQIRVPIHIMWGSSDHLPDTQSLLRSMPTHATSECFDQYEHLDFMYAHEALQAVFPKVITRLQRDTQASWGKKLPNTSNIPSKARHSEGAN